MPAVAAVHDRVTLEPVTLLTVSAAGAEGGTSAPPLKPSESNDAVVSVPAAWLVTA